jgi:hypothetical protein
MQRLRYILKGEVFLEGPRRRLKRLVTMNGITEEQQQELWDLVVKSDRVSLIQLRALCEYYYRLGATYAHPDG